MEQWSLLDFLLTNKQEVDCCAHHCVEYDCPEVAYEDLVVQGPGCFCKRWKFALITTTLVHSNLEFDYNFHEERNKRLRPLL